MSSLALIPILKRKMSLYFIEHLTSRKHPSFIITKTRVEGDVFIMLHVKKRMLRELLLFSKTQAWSLESFDSLNCQTQEELSCTKGSEHYSLDWKAERLSIKNIMKLSCQKSTRKESTGNNNPNI